MKNYLLSVNSFYTTVGLMAALFFLNSCEPKEYFSPDLTKEFDLKSEINGANYHIRVALPTNYNQSSEKYATIYVLDGPDIFEVVANRCKEISDKNGVANTLVISIDYGKDRSIDYTPTKVSTVTGGAPDYLKFIETQLIPKIEKDFRTVNNREGRVILGHSYGGLFGGYCFTMNNKVFGNYILLSPSFWFDKLVSLKMEKENRASNKDKKQLVFMGIGGNENTGQMQAPFEAFYEVLHDNYTHIKLAKHSAANLEHLGSRGPNIEKGLEFYFQNR
jgi:uncharacterized protein